MAGCASSSAIVSHNQGGPGWWPDPTLRTPAAFGVAGIATSILVTAYAPADPGRQPHHRCHLDPQPRRDVRQHDQQRRCHRGRDGGDGIRVCTASVSSYLPACMVPRDMGCRTCMTTRFFHAGFVHACGRYHLAQTACRSKSKRRASRRCASARAVQRRPSWRSALGTWSKRRASPRCGSARAAQRRPCW